MGELQLSIQDEMSRIEQNYKSDYEIALVGPVIDSAAIL
jgi:hypothetical protein